MGEVCKISCECGYAKELYIGCGLTACNINMVNMVFSKEKLKEFNKCMEDRKVQSFFVENRTSICNKCREIMTVAFLTVELTNGTKFKVINDCLKCGNKVEMLGDLFICPKCGKKMDKKDVGDWD